MGRRAVTMSMGLLTLGLAVGGLVACTPGEAGEVGAPSPSLTVPSSTPTPSPTPAPTTAGSAEKQAVLDAFAGYWRSAEDAANRGGGDKLPTDLARRVTGSERAYQLSSLRYLKRHGFAASGHGTLLNIKLSEQITATTRSTYLTACADQTSRVVTKNGRLYSGNPQYVLITDAKLRREGGVWKVAQLGSERLSKGQTCADLS